MSPIARRIVLTAASLLAVAWPRLSHAQIGTGGSTGTTTSGTLAQTDFFLGLQKVKDTNLNAYDQQRYLNVASCQCKRPITLRAVLEPSAPAATISPTAQVSMYLGSSCNSTTLTPYCLLLAGGVPFSEFRVKGISVNTSVDVISQVYSSTGVICTTGTGGASGTGGSSGTGGDSGSGGSSGTGGVTGTTTCPTGPCTGVKFTQTLWVLVSNSGTLGDVGSASLNFSIDPEPPPSVTNVATSPANQALIVNWTGIDPVSIGGDLLGYQVLCARGGTLQVFKTGTFSPAFDSPFPTDSSNCPDPTLAIQAATGTDPVSELTETYACSDLLGAATTSERLKILENDIPYSVGVVAIDLALNPSTIPLLTKGIPEITYDFYTTYRHNNTQGQATGGYCSVADGPANVKVAGALAALSALGLCLGFGWRRRTRRRR